jgi:hypothetical protein
MAAGLGFSRTVGGNAAPKKEDYENEIRGNAAIPMRERRDRPSNACIRHTNRIRPHR